MTEREKLEKVVKGLEICSSGEWNSTGGRDHTSCPYYPAGYTGCTCKLLMRDALALLKSLSAFKKYFDGLYGQGLDVANYHLNGATEPFDNFYDSVMEEYENARCADTQRDYQAAVEMTEYCEHYESTYNPDDGSM